MAGGQALRVGVVGLGMIGGGIAQCLARAGRALSVYDVRGQAAAGLPGVPAVLDSAAAVARQSDVVIIAVVTAAQARDVLTGPAGLLAGARGKLTVVLVSTVALQKVRELGALAAQAGMALIDAGVTGGDKAATGGLVAMVGGPAESVEAMRPVLEDFARPVLYMGPLGSGMATKLARNVITYGIWRVVYEAGLLAETAGVDLQKLVHAVRESDPRGELGTFWLAARNTVAMLPPDDTPGRGRANYVAQLLHKDLEAALELAAEMDLALPVTALAAAHGDQTLGLRP